jgi:hypothetical protein
MELWTEYEGITIDGAFPLKELLLPEGRSAFFSTANSKGEPTLIRLIACHFDEEEILSRWRGVEALNHRDLLKLERYGQLVLDNVTVVYAVFERVDGNLDQVLNERRLTIPETTQLAASLTSALETLHANGFVHEHIAPANVYAVGDLVKLRSECIRETPEGEKGLGAKKRDVHDLSVVLLEALTRERTMEPAGRAHPLPAPFDQIVRNGMSGAWGIEEIMAALQSAERTLRTSSKTASSPTRTAVQQPVIPSAKPLSSPRTAAPEPRTTSAGAPAARLNFPAEDPVPVATLRSKWIGASALAAFVMLLALWLVWHFAHSRPANQNSAKQATSTPATTTPATRGNVTAPARTGAPAAAANAGPPQNNAAAGIREQWRVVAYTYNRQDQAQKKAASVAQKHPELRPEVFTPTGHAPYLVTFGGVMNRDEAFAFARKSRTLGLARDTYAQNYNVNGR